MGGARRERETGLRRAPAVGSRESENDGGGGALRRAQGERIRGARLRSVGCAEVRVAEGEVPACAGTTMGGGNDDGGGGPPSCALRIGFDGLRACGFVNWRCG